jgi:hypothetical protein
MQLMITISPVQLLEIEALLMELGIQKLPEYLYDERIISWFDNKG